MKRFIPAMFILFFALLGRGSLAYAAPRLTLDPSSKTIQVNQSYETKITIDAEENQAFGAEAIILFPQSDIEITNIQNGGFFPDFTYATTEGRIEIRGIFANLYDTKAGSGTLATFTVKALTDSGDGRLTFVCQGNQASQILNQDGNNILSCASLNTQTITFAAPSDTPTHTPTRTPTVTPPAGGSPTPLPTTPGTNLSATPVKSATPSRTPTKTPTRKLTKSPTPKISSSPTKTPSRTPTSRLSPTPQEAVFTLIQSLTPTPGAPSNGTEPFDPIRWFLGLGVLGTAVIIGGYLILRGRRQSHEPPPMYHG